MRHTLTGINSLLVDIFNDVLIIEENALRAGSFTDVSVKEMHTIEAIGMYEPKSMGEVAKKLSITVGTLSVAIKNLEKKGYVERIRCEHDRRLVRLGLTKKGRLLYRIHDKFHVDMIQGTIDGFNNEELRVLTKGLENLNVFLKCKYDLCEGEK